MTEDEWMDDPSARDAQWETVEAALTAGTGPEAIDKPALIEAMPWLREWALSCYRAGHRDGWERKAASDDLADAERAASPRPDADASRDVTTVQAMIERARQSSADGSTRYRQWWADGAEAAVTLLAARVKGLAEKSVDEASKAGISRDREAMMVATGRSLGLYAALDVVEGKA